VADFEEELGDLAAGEEAIGQEEDLYAATQGQLKMVRPEVVKYTKRAKRVDIRKLKETIWRNLEPDVGKVSRIILSCCHTQLDLYRVCRIKVLQSLLQYQSSGPRLSRFSTASNQHIQMISCPK
jgi:hypothetical protein